MCVCVEGGMLLEYIFVNIYDQCLLASTDNHLLNNY